MQPKKLVFLRYSKYHFSNIQAKNFFLKTTFPHSKLLKMWKTFCRKNAISVVFAVICAILSTFFQHCQPIGMLKLVFLKKIYFSVFCLKRLHFSPNATFLDICISALHFCIFQFVKNTICRIAVTVYLVFFLPFTEASDFLVNLLPELIFLRPSMCNLLFFAGLASFFAPL